MRNLQEQVKKAFCYQKLFWPLTVWINCSSDLKNIANSPPSASNFKSFSRSLEQFFLTVGQNKIPFLHFDHWKLQTSLKITWGKKVFSLTLSRALSVAFVVCGKVFSFTDSYFLCLVPTVKYIFKKFFFSVRNLALDSAEKII